MQALCVLSKGAYREAPVSFSPVITITQPKQNSYLWAKLKLNRAIRSGFAARLHVEVAAVASISQMLFSPQETGTEGCQRGSFGRSVSHLLQILQNEKASSAAGQTVVSSQIRGNSWKRAALRGEMVSSGRRTASGQWEGAAELQTPDKGTASCQPGRAPEGGPPGASLYLARDLRPRERDRFTDLETSTLNPGP